METYTFIPGGHPGHLPSSTQRGKFTWLFVIALVSSFTTHNSCLIWLLPATFSKSAVPLPSLSPRKIKLYVCTNINFPAIRAATYVISGNWKAPLPLLFLPQCFTDQYIVRQPYNGTSLSDKKLKPVDEVRNMGESQRRSAEQKKLVSSNTCYASLFGWHSGKGQTGSRDKRWRIATVEAVSGMTKAQGKGGVLGRRDTTLCCKSWCSQTPAWTETFMQPYTLSIFFRRSGWVWRCVNVPAHLQQRNV